jgi:cyanate permease
MGSAFGIINATSFLAALVAPYATGWLKDWTGSFAGGCYLAAAVAVAGVPVALAVRSPRGSAGSAAPRGGQGPRTV